MAGKAKALGRDALMAAAVRRTKEFKVERLGGKVRIRELSAGARNAYARPFVEAELKGTEIDVERVMNLRALAVCKSLVDDDGELIFTDEDVGIVLDWPSDVLDDLWEHVDALNGLTKAAIKEIEGN